MVGIFHRDNASPLLSFREKPARSSEIKFIVSGRKKRTFGKKGRERVSRMPVSRLVDNVCVTNQTRNERGKKRGLGDLESGACGGVNEKVGELDNDYRIQHRMRLEMEHEKERERESAINCSFVRFGDFPSITKKDRTILSSSLSIDTLFKKLRNFEIDSS